jgi:hypothetical protein
MAIALDLLWDEFDREMAIGLIGDAGKRADVLERLGILALEAGGAMPGTTGDNLLMGVIALRVKFTREESVEKLIRNLQMRAAPGGGTP